MNNNNLISNQSDDDNLIPNQSDDDNLIPNQSDDDNSISNEDDPTFHQINDKDPISNIISIQHNKISNTSNFAVPFNDNYTILKNIISCVNNHLSPNFPQILIKSISNLMIHSIHSSLTRERLLKLAIVSSLRDK